MKCPVCGAAYPADSKFCRVDGTPLVPVAVAAAQAAPAVVAGGRKSSRAGIVAAVAVLALAVAAGAGYFAFRSPSTGERPGGQPGTEPAAGKAGTAGSPEIDPESAPENAAGRGGSAVRDDGSTRGRDGRSLLEASGTMTRVTGEIMTDLSKGREDTLIGKGLAVGGGINTAVGSTVEDVARGEASGSELSPGNLSRRAAEGASASERSPDQPQNPRERSGGRRGDREPSDRCRKNACFEIFAAQLTPAVARPGQTVRCTARYTFRHNEGGTGRLQVEESVKVGMRSGRGDSRRVDAGPGPNLFDVPFKVPARADAGTYPVTLSVRRRSITESIRLQLVVEE